MNANTEYEILVKKIYEDLHQLDGIQNINIQHNVFIAGKSKQRHQIDVYWEFTFADQTYKVAIECKNYSKNVSIGKVRDFYGVLADIGNIQGIMISREGFQSGAIQYAKQFGITLKEIRFPHLSDWEDRLKTIDISGRIYGKNIHKISVVFDIEWVKSNRPDLRGNSVLFSKEAKDVVIFNDDGTLQITVAEILESIPLSAEGEQGEIALYKHTFESGYIIDETYGKLKLVEIDFEYSPWIIESKIYIDAENLLKGIIRDVETGEIKFLFDNDK